MKNKSNKFNNIVKLRGKLQTIKLFTTFLKASLLYRTVLLNPRSRLAENNSSVKVETMLLGKKIEKSETDLK